MSLQLDWSTTQTWLLMFLLRTKYSAEICIPTLVFVTVQSGICCSTLLVFRSWVARLLISFQKRERTYKIDLPAATLARFLSVTSSALYQSLASSRSFTGNSVLAFDIKDDDVEDITCMLSLQLSTYTLCAAQDFTGDNSTASVYSHLPFHVAVHGDRSVDGKKEYDLYYRNRCVKTRIYFVSTGTDHRWKVSDLKWYFYNS